MAILYTQNSEKWKTLASIDYFTHFVKAWIPFNAWYKNYYPDCKTDRQAVDYIKNHPNAFRNQLVSLLTSSSINGASFRLHIAELHLALENNYVFNKNERINFVEISIKSNRPPSSSFFVRGCKYEVKRCLPNRTGEIDIHIYKKDGSRSFFYTQVDGFDLQNLLNHSDFKRLSLSQQDNLKACYEEVNPKKLITLISRNPDVGIDAGPVRFIPDTDALSKGVIEILYKLRNTLFHGEVIPDNNASKIYEPAYQILHTLVQSL